MVNESRCALTVATLIIAAAGCAPGRQQIASNSAPVAAASTPLPAPAEPCPPEPSGAPSRFEFHSSEWLNLNNFLFRDGKQRRGIHDDARGSRGNVPGDTAATRPLTPAERAVWSRAVDFFADFVVTDRLRMDSAVVRINQLALARPGSDLRDVPLDTALRRVLVEAAPIYHAVWWPVHDARNRRWIRGVRAQLARGETCLAERTARALGASWPAALIRVDVAVCANWFGAYATLDPVHVTISSTAVGTQGSYGMEGLFHEAGHGLLAHVDSALTAEAARQHKALPPELAHLVLFYTAGDVISRAVSGHTPFASAFGIWSQNTTAEHYHTLLAREWAPHLRGERSLTDAVARVVAGL